MTKEWVKLQLDQIIADDYGGEFWITTSRRTPPEVEALIDSYQFGYKLIYSKDHFNPIPAFVGMCKRLYVTAESTGMLSEACTCGAAEVVALDNLNKGPSKFRKFLCSLVAGGYAKLLGGEVADRVDETDDRPSERFANRKVDLTAQITLARQLLGL